MVAEVSPERKWLYSIEEQSSPSCLVSSSCPSHSLKQSHSDSHSRLCSAVAHLSTDVSPRWNYFLLNPQFNPIASLLSLSLSFSGESLNLLDLRSECSTASHKQPSHPPSLKAAATWWLPPLGGTTSATGSERPMGMLERSTPTKLLQIHIFHINTSCITHNVLHKSSCLKNLLKTATIWMTKNLHRLTECLSFDYVPQTILVTFLNYSQLLLLKKPS